MKDKSEVEIVDLVLKLREKLVSPSLSLRSFLSLGGEKSGTWITPVPWKTLFSFPGGLGNSGKFVFV